MKERFLLRHRDALRLPLRSEDAGIVLDHPLLVIEREGLANLVTRHASIEGYTAGIVFVPLLITENRIGVVAIFRLLRRDANPGIHALLEIEIEPKGGIFRRAGRPERVGLPLLERDPEVVDSRSRVLLEVRVVLVDKDGGKGAQR